MKKMSVNQTKSSYQGFPISHIGYNNKQEVGNLETQKTSKLRKAILKQLPKYYQLRNLWKGVNGV